MPTVAEVLAVKGSDMFTVSPEVTVLGAIRRMNARQIGRLSLLKKMDGVVGMFTERDVLRRVMAEMVPPDAVRVREVMTRDVICCSPAMDVEDVGKIMKEKRIRHLPVCDEFGDLLGLISIGDLNAFHCSDVEQKISSLTDYIYGRG